MTTVSSHILDSVTGDHAKHIRVQCFHLSADHTRTLKFDVRANEQGRITETVDTDRDAAEDRYELVFHSDDYFSSMSLPDDSVQILTEVVVRIGLPKNDAACHIPVVLSPHSYTIWWSK